MGSDPQPMGLLAHGAHHGCTRPPFLKQGSPIDARLPVPADPDAL